MPDVLPEAQTSPRLQSPWPGPTSLVLSPGAVVKCGVVWVVILGEEGAKWELLASCGERPGIVLNTHNTGGSSPRKDVWPTVLMAPC